MSAEKQILAYTKIYGKSETEVKEKLFTDTDGKLELNDDFADVLISWDEAKVNKFKEKETTAFNNGHKKAQKESLSELEKLYREAGILTDSETSADVVAKFEALKTTSKKGTLTDDDVKKHPLFLSYEEKVKKEYLPKAEHEAKLREFEDKLNNIAKGEKMSMVKNEALKHFNPNDYLLSEDPARRQNQINVFNNELLKRFDDVEKTGDTLILIKDGKRLEDNHGNPINFNSVIDEVALSLYDKKAQDAKGSANNQNNSPKNTTAKITFKATTLSELNAERNKLQSEAKTSEEKILIGKLALEHEKILRGK